MPVPAISVQNLSKVYNGGTKALDSISFDVEKGDFFGYLGPNGAGKTTTIHILCGLTTASTGKVEVFGHDVVKDYRLARGSIGLAKQDLAFDPYLRLREMLVYQGGYYGMKGKELEDRVDRLIKAFELEAKEYVTWRKLSGGMKRRLELAKALVHDPEVLILDEPTEGVDVQLRRTLWKFFQKENREGKTILLTTHYIEEAQRLCDRICILNGGKIVANDKTETLLSELSEQKIVLKFKDAIPGDLGQVAGYSAVSDTEKKMMTLTCKNAQEALPKILQELSKKKMEVKNVEMVKDQLEDIFLRLTGGEADEFAGV